MPELVANGIVQHWLEEGTGPPVLLLHAIAADSQMWSKLVKHMAAQFRTIAVDLRDHGRSHADDRLPSTELLAEDVVSLVERLDLGRFSLVGASMGGTVACHVAARLTDRVERLVLLSTWYHPNAETRLHFAQMAEAAASPERFAEFYVEGFRLSRPAPSDAVLNLIRRTAPRPRPSLPAFVQACDAHDVRAALPRITARVLSIVGSEDPTARWQAALTDALPLADRLVIDGGGHNLMFDKPKEVMRPIVSFLQAEVSAVSSGGPETPR